MRRLLVWAISRLWNDLYDYLKYVGEEIRNEGKDDDEMIAWELRSIPVDDTLKGVKAKAKSYASRIRKGINK